QTTQAPRLDLPGKKFQFIQIRRLALTRTDTIQNIEHTASAHTAEGAFPTTLILGELQEIAGHIHHAIGIVQHHEPAGAHDRTDLRQCFEVHGDVLHGSRDTTTGGPTDLDRLEGPPRHHPAADLLHNLANREPHRHLDQATTHHL